MSHEDLESINALRALSLDTIQKANSGHPGMCLGAAPMAFALWQHQLCFCASQPDWPDRDRFVLSAGHGSALLYGLLHLFGYALELKDMMAFRQWGSKTPGHPEVGLTPGVEATTGPLGQGHANAVGMAIAERALAFRFNRSGFEVVNHHTYALLSDGDMMEGVAFEAAAVAGHLRLGKLICLYDSNDVSLDGPTSLCFTEDVGTRYKAMGWHIQEVEDGDSDSKAIEEALLKAKEEVLRPSLIVVKTTLGFGSPNKAGKAAAHGSPLGIEEVEKTKGALGWPKDSSFWVPEQVYAHCAKAARRGAAAFEAWKGLFADYAVQHPELAKEFERRLRGELPAVHLGEGLEALLPKNSLETRSAASLVLQSLGKQLPELLGGDADLSSSTKSALAGERDFNGQTGEGRNIRFGVREHGMAAIANGIALHGQFRPYVSTFFSFCDYMRPSIRLAALSRLPVVYIFTHDSIGVGEDGPTHQPVEQLMSLRSIPNLDVVRPCDGPEAAWAWVWALQRREGPTALILTRQKLPYLDRSQLAPAKMLSYGAYVLKDASGPLEGVFLASGSEVQLALAAQSLLSAQGIAVRVLSVPCMEAFRRMPKGYRDEVLPLEICARVAIEAGIPMGWHEWVGVQGSILGMEGFGASAPAEVLFRKFGLSAQAAAEAMLKQLGKFSSST
ncbi:MAG: transketolase [Proteobacteria bacterium]|nr:transketolase [Cystobacterineae bacterium]MCL2314223.1 transketolase [Pseudomonadota bacterium]